MLGSEQRALASEQRALASEQRPPGMEHMARWLPDGGHGGITHEGTYEATWLQRDPRA